jgi:hypothetical protein
LSELFSYFFLFKKRTKELLISSVNKPENERTAEETRAYEQFRNTLNDIVREVNGLDENTRSQWTSKLTMVYHWKKHKKDFGPQISVSEYFNTYSSEIFKTENIIGSTHSQFGGFIKRTYARSFGSRVHVGFTFGESEKKLSHFTKKV